MLFCLFFLFRASCSRPPHEILGSGDSWRMASCRGWVGGMAPSVAREREWQWPGRCGLVGACDVSSRRLLSRLFLEAVAKGAGATLDREGLDLGSTVGGAQRVEEEGFCSLGRQSGQRRRSCPSRLVSGIAYKGAEGGETRPSAVATR